MVVVWGLRSLTPSPSPTAEGEGSIGIGYVSRAALLTAVFDGTGQEFGDVGDEWEEDIEAFGDGFGAAGEVDDEG